MMNKRLMQITMILFLLVALAACQPGSEADVDTAVAKQTANTKPVQQDTASISAEGLVEPLFFVQLSFQGGGEVAEILVSEGDSVAQGDALIQLDATQQEIALVQAEARLVSANAALTAAQKQVELAQAAVNSADGIIQSAEANLALTQAGPLPEEIAAAEANVAAAESAVNQAAAGRDVALDISSEADIFAAEARLAAAQADLRALEEGYQDIIDACFELPDGSEVCPLYGAVEENTREQLNAATLNRDAAQEALNALREGPTAAQTRAASGSVGLAIANRDAAQAQLDLLLAGATPEQIAIAEIGVEQAQAAKAIAEASLIQAEAGVTQAEAGVTQAEANVAQAEAAMERTILRATFDGQVSRISTSLGQLVAPGTPVITLADFSEWLVQTTDLTELDVAAVEVGANSEVQLDAIPDETINGVVTNVAFLPSLSQGDVVYEVTISLEERTDLPIRWGMTAFVDIEGN